MAKLYKLNEQSSQGLPLPETGPSPNPQLLDVNAKPRLGMKKYTQNKNLVEVGQMGIKNGSWLVNLLVF